ncbi:hypothetical protein EXS73_03585 [Candidatus Pacearchaeota archaeon]|nr:hypothetical protein [Candidatus Pacearchaeota archaeon]
MGEIVQSRIILEVLGRPPEEVAAALDLLIQNIGKEAGVTVIGSDMHDPVPVKDSKDLFTAFAEVTIETTTLEHLFGILFAYMPSNVEVISPQEIIYTNATVNHFANILLTRLHNYDAISKKLLNEKNFMTQELYKVAPHLFKKQDPTPAQQQSAPAVEHLKEPKKESKASKKAKKNKKK